MNPEEVNLEFDPGEAKIIPEDPDKLVKVLYDPEDIITASDGLADSPIPLVNVSLDKITDVLIHVPDVDGTDKFLPFVSVDFLKKNLKFRKSKKIEKTVYVPLEDVLKNFQAIGRIISTGEKELSDIAEEDVYLEYESTKNSTNEWEEKSLEDTPNNIPNTPNALKNIPDNTQSSFFKNVKELMGYSPLNDTFHEASESVLDINSDADLNANFNKENQSEISPLKRVYDHIFECMKSDKETF